MLVASIQLLQHQNIIVAAMFRPFQVSDLRHFVLCSAVIEGEYSMSVRFDLPRGGGKRALRLFMPAARFTLPVVALAVLCVGSGAAEGGGAILKKMVDNYSNASAYTATIITHQKGKTQRRQRFFTYQIASNKI